MLDTHNPNKTEPAPSLEHEIGELDLILRTWGADANRSMRGREFLKYLLTLVKETAEA